MIREFRVKGREGRSLSPSPSPSPHVRTQQEGSPLQVKRETESVGTMILRFPASTTVRNTCLSHPVCSILLQSLS